MKIRLLQAGFETYNGQMGRIFFEEGVSTADVPEIEARRMAAVMHIEYVESGVNPSDAQTLLETGDVPAPDVTTGEAGHDAAAEAVAAAAPAPVKSYSAEELGAVADAQGIKGLRAIAEPLGIKDNSVKGLIAEIVKKTAPVAPVEQA